MPEQFLPYTPSEGPPVPRGIFPRWPWLKNPVNTANIAPNAEIRAMTSREKPENNAEANPGEQDDFVLVLRKKPINPTWLKEHQKRFAEASSKAAALTQHLSGEEKLRARRELVSKMLKDNA